MSRESSPSANQPALAEKPRVTFRAMHFESDECAGPNLEITCEEQPPPYTPSYTTPVPPNTNMAGMWLTTWKAVKRMFSSAPAERDVEQASIELLPHRPVNELLPLRPVNELLPLRPANELLPLRPVNELLPLRPANELRIPSEVPNVHDLPGNDREGNAEGSTRRNPNHLVLDLSPIVVILQLVLDLAKSILNLAKYTLIVVVFAILIVVVFFGSALHCKILPEAACQAKDLPPFIIHNTTNT